MIIKPNKKKLYWNKVSEKEMKEMLKVAKKDYKKAVKKMNINDWTKDYILNEKTRGKIVDLIIDENKTKEPKVLDIGAGFGAVSILLARKFNTTAIDVNTLTLKFIEYRAKQEKQKIKLKKINQLAYGLQFKDNSFDIIVMNGVLEWVACGVKGNVNKIQQKVLEEIFRVLKKQGLLVFAIENRIAYDWFKGKTSHVSIKYADLMPRWLANLISLKKRKGKYRTYIYSRVGYKKMLKKAGFNNLKFYTAYPTYQKPQKITPNRNPFVNSFIILAKKD